VPVIIWSGVIFALSSLPSTPAPETLWNFLLKKGAHVAEYAILYWLTWRAMNHERRTTNQYVGPLLFTIFYAITDEIHQSFVPGRHARWYDIGFDTFGALLALQILRRHHLGNSS
jgi:VanZ family protein